MADKKLSSVSAVSDMNYVYAETSNGETVKISKGNLASVMAGLITPAWGLSNKGSLAAGASKSMEIPNRTFSIVAITSWSYYWIYAVFYSGSDTITGIELASNKRSDVEISFESNKIVAKNKSQTSEYRLDMFRLTSL